MPPQCPECKMVLNGASASTLKRHWSKMKHPPRPRGRPMEDPFRSKEVAKAARARVYNRVCRLNKPDPRKRHRTRVGDVLVVHPRAGARPDEEPVEMTPATAAEMQEINDDYVVVEDDYCIRGPPVGGASECRDATSEVESSDPESDDSIAWKVRRLRRRARV